jgi:hypothetical protein
MAFRSTILSEWLLVIYNFGIISCMFRRKTRNLKLKSFNYKHKNTGAGVSYSGRNGQWNFPYKPTYLSRVEPYEVNQVIIFHPNFMEFRFMFKKYV